MSRFSRARNVKDPVAALAAPGDCACMKKVKPPVAPEGCIEVYSTKGVNLIADPSFSQTYSGGPNNETFPGEIGAGQGPWELSWSGISPAAYSPWAVFTNDGGGSANMWEIATTNPHSGVQHAYFYFDAAEFGESDTDLMPLLPEVCNCCTGGYKAYMSAIISPGDLITASIWAARNTTEIFDMDVYVEIWNQDWSTQILENGNYSQPLSNGGTYQQFSYQVVAPANSYWLQVFYVFSRASGNFPTDGDEFYMDDASLVIT